MTLSRVSVQEFGGRTFGVMIDSSANKLSDLKVAIQNCQGAPTWRQTLFLLDSSGQATSADPMRDDVVVADESCVALCVSNALGASKLAIIFHCCPPQMFLQVCVVHLSQL